MKLLPKRKWMAVIAFGLVLSIAIAVFASRSNNAESPHNSWINPSMSEFFNQYDIYYTGWDNYLVNGSDLGLAETGSSSLQAIKIGLSNTSNSAAKDAEVVRDFQKAQTEGRDLIIYPHSSYVIESHSPDESNISYGALSPTLLTFNGQMYTRTSNSDYFIDGTQIVYVGCLYKKFDEQTKGNLCFKFGLFVNDKMVDNTAQATGNEFADLTISLINNHIIYYTKTDNSGNNNYYSYNLNTGEITLLNDSDGFSCGILGFVGSKPVDFCPNYDTTPLHYDILIGGIPTYNLTVPQGLGIWASENVAVINNHVYYTVVDKSDKQPTKISLIKDGLKVAEAEIDQSQYFMGVVHPTDGSQVGCLMDNNLPTPQFCIIGDNIISKSNFGFDQNQYYLNGQNIDFSPYNIELNPQSPSYKANSQNIWELDLLPSTNVQIAKIILKTLEPNNIYVSDLLPNATLTTSKLLVSNVGGIVGASLK